MTEDQRAEFRKEKLSLEMEFSIKLNRLKEKYKILDASTSVSVDEIDVTDSTINGKQFIVTNTSINFSITL